MKRPTVRTGLICVAGTLVTGDALAQYKYIDSGNPTGVPDLTQTGLGGVCGAASMANALWEWSNHAPFNTAANPLVTHTNQANFATDWGPNSNALTRAVADKIYGAVNADTGARAGGLGMSAGVVRYAADRNLAYNRVNQPTGLSIEYTGGWQNITYSQLNAIVDNGVRNAVVGVKWYEADQTTTIKRPAALGGADRYHALTLAGMDNTNKRIALSNPWGDHVGGANPPVSTAYYDDFKLDGTRITNNDRAVLTRADNAGFVSAFDIGDHRADTVWPVALWQVRQGGSPNVVGDVINVRGVQQVRYTVENPDSADPIHNAYMLMNPSVIDIISAYDAAQNWLASNQPDWSVTLIDPNSGPGADLFAVTGESDPTITEDYALVDWQSGAAGLMFSSPTGLFISESVELGFDLPGFVPKSEWNDVYAVSNFDNTHAWFGVTIPTPSSLALLGLTIAIRRRRAG